MNEYKSFNNMEVNMVDFENVYNSYAKTPISFGGGTLTVNNLINKYFPKKVKGGGSFFNDFRPQFTPTNVNSMPDYTYNTLDYPNIVSNSRS